MSHFLTITQYTRYKVKVLHRHSNFAQIRRIKTPDKIEYLHRNISFVIIISKYITITKWIITKYKKGKKEKRKKEITRMWNVEGKKQHTFLLNWKPISIVQISNFIALNEKNETFMRMLSYKHSLISTFIFRYLIMWNLFQMNE